MAIKTRDLTWDELEAMGAGDLFNAMLANFDSRSINDDDIEIYNQNGTYFAAAEILNKRFPGKDA